ncbi:MAG: serine hydrolase, partial [bacterium]|nr:serine hydrolase [bacterium]
QSKRIPFYLLLLFTILLIAPFTVQAKDVKDNPGVSSALHFLENWLEAQCAYEDIPGLSIAVVHDQELVWSKGFGHAHREKKIPATADTMYSICSISKLFTSIGVMQLRDKGKLDLDDKINRHLSWFSIEDTYPDSAPVTIRGILTHSSGLPRESALGYWSGNFKFPTREEMIKHLSKQKMLYPGETFFQYSNLGLSLAGAIVAQVSGQPYSDYVNANILGPLGLKDTRPELPEEHMGGRFASGYSAPSREGKRTKLPSFKANGIAPAAGYSSTVKDLAAFASWQFRLLEKGGEEVLKVTTLKEMQRVHWMEPDWTISWGLGFRVYRREKKKFTGHGGHCPGFQSTFMMQPDSKVAVIVMSNANSVGTSGFANNAYDIVAPAIEKALEAKEEPKETKTDFKKYTGTYSLQPWGGEMAVFIRDGKLTMIAFPSEDPLKAVQKCKHIEANTFRRVRRDGKLAEEIIFVMDADGKVSHMLENDNTWPKMN